jgi:hypothetical protein
MNSKLITKKILGEVKMADKFAGAKTTKKIKFCGEEVAISKLSVKDVLAIQRLAKEAEGSTEEKAQLNIMVTVLRKGCADLEPMDEDALFDLPMDELSKLSAAIMDYSGMGKPS